MEIGLNDIGNEVQQLGASVEEKQCAVQELQLEV